MKEELAAAFLEVCQPGDEVLILPVFYAGGATTRSVTSGDLVKELVACGAPAFEIKDYDELLRHLLDRAQADDAVLCMGARDPELPLFARRLLKALSK